jgi:hypothetical protein
VTRQTGQMGEPFLNRFKAGTMPTRAQLLAVLADSDADVPADLEDNAPLITSGLLDSTALFQLALWMEEHVAPGLDLTTFDVTSEWGSVTRLLAFIERHAR